MGTSTANFDMHINFDLFKNGFKRYISETHSYNFHITYKNIIHLVAVSGFIRIALPVVNCVTVIYNPTELQQPNA